MSIESLKRWHWALIGLLLGLLIAWSQIQIGVDGMFAAGEHKTIGQLDFERGLRQPPMHNYSIPRDYPIIRNLIVYPDGKRFVLRMKRLEPHPQFPGDRRGYRYVDYSLVTTQPYLPATDLKKTVEVVILPAESKIHVNLSADRGGVASKFSNWSNGSSRARDPGRGAQVEVALRPADYQLTVLTENPAGMDQLSVTFNKAPLPAFNVAPGGNAMLWQTSIPRSAFSADARQTLEFSRLSNPIPIHQIRLLDPSYTVLSYLSEAGTTAKPLAYRFGWWTRPNALLGLWALGAVALIGGVWPTVLNLLVGAGFGRPHVAEAEYDLNRFKGGESESKPQPAQVTAEDEEEMAELEKRLMAQLSEAPIESIEIEKAPAPIPVAPRVLVGQPVQPLPAPAGSAEEDSSRSYKGEFYPVVRPPPEHQ